MVVDTGDDDTGNDTDALSGTCHSTIVLTPTDVIDIVVVDFDVCSSDGDVF